MPDQETPEAFYSRLCPGEWPVHDEAKLVELAARMKDSKARRAARERTSAMPSGYVYLGQFIDHDLTRDGRFVVEDAGPDVERTPNYRTPCLDLDILYGKRGSPGPCVDVGTGKISLGMTLAVKLQDREFSPGPDDLARTADGTAVAIDPRSDENLIVAQMQVLLAKFHNQVLRLLKEEPELSVGPIGGTPFEQARRFVTWHYQWIIQHDFLPQLARRAVLQDIHANGLRLFPRVYTPADYPINLPIEFTVAAYRFGHSMIQENYRLNEFVAVEAEALLILTKRGGGINPDAPALPAHCVIDWDFFFTAPEALLNRGENIDTFIIEALYHLPSQTVASFRVKPNARAQAGKPLGEIMRPLPELTLRRGSRMRLPSGEEFADHFGLPKLAEAQIAALPEDEEFFAQPGFRGRTPLWYYLLREAAVEGEVDPESNDGPAPPMQRLGTIGSRIVAEVLLQVIAADAESIRNAGAGWKPPKFIFGLSKEPRSISSMPALIEFVQTRDRDSS